ncbi:MAG: prefoldin subunit [Nanoarchaeota archaeon]
MSQQEIERLQQIESSLSQTISQKQGYQQYLYDIDTALGELDNRKDAYQIVGTIMVKKSSDDIRSDLEERKNIYSKRLEALKRQEKTLREEAQKLQDSALGSLQQD